MFGFIGVASALTMTTKETVKNFLRLAATGLVTGAATHAGFVAADKIIESVEKKMNNKDEDCEIIGM